SPQAPVSTGCADQCSHLRRRPWLWIGGVTECVFQRCTLGLDLRENWKSPAGDFCACDQQFAGVFGRHGPPPLAGLLKRPPNSFPVRKGARSTPEGTPVVLSHLRPRWMTVLTSLCRYLSANSINPSASYTSGCFKV